jgi:hypothetical protein
MRPVRSRVDIRCVLVALRVSSTSICVVHSIVNTAGSQTQGVKGKEHGCNLESVSVFP